MWNLSHHFHIKNVDDKRKTYDCVISTSFEVEFHSHENDREPSTITLRYYGVLEDIIDLDFMFLRNLFYVEWYKIIKVGEEKTILLDNNGFHMINTSRFGATFEPYVFPNQCSQIFSISNLEKPGWSFVIEYDPRRCRVTFLQDLEDHYLLEDAKVPLEDVDGQDGYDENFMVDDAYDHDEDYGDFIEVSKGHEQPHGHQIHEDDEFIYFHLHVDQGDEHHENSGVNLFVDLGLSNDGVFMPSN